MANPTAGVSSTVRPVPARERLLDAGEKLFAEKGFDGTAIRDITAAARCNVAAVSYYFGGKEKLYQEVFQRRFESLRELRISRLEAAMRAAGQDATLELVVSTFTEAFLEPLVAVSAWRHLMKLFTREMFSPHLPRGMLVREMIEPTEAAMTRALCSVEPGLDEDTARLCTFSLISQLVHVTHARSFLEDRDEPLHFRVGRHEAVEHINRFTVGAIRSLLNGGAR